MDPWPERRRRFAKAIFCCWMFGRKRKRLAASTMTSPGRVSWAQRCLRNTRRSLKWCVTPATKRSSLSAPRSPRVNRCKAGKWIRPRAVIEKAGYGKYFFHRTGHSIGESVHGNGVNMDGMETRDVRHLIAGTCNSIEPGIYLPEFGIRSEVNMYIGEREARVTGTVQQEILPLLA